MWWVFKTLELSLVAAVTCGVVWEDHTAEVYGMDRAGDGNVYRHF